MTIGFFSHRPGSKILEAEFDSDRPFANATLPDMLTQAKKHGFTHYTVHYIAADESGIGSGCGPFPVDYIHPAPQWKEDDRYTQPPGGFRGISGGPMR